MARLGYSGSREQLGFSFLRNHTSTTVFASWKERTSKALDRGSLVGSQMNQWKSEWTWEQRIHFSQRAPSETTWRRISSRCSVAWRGL